jgi:hypothetical protein
MNKIIYYFLFLLLMFNVEGKDYYGYLLTTIPAPVYDVVIDVNQLTQSSYNDYTIHNCNYNVKDGFWRCNGKGKEFNVVMISKNDKENYYDIGILYYIQKRLIEEATADGKPSQNEIFNRQHKRVIEFRNIDIRNLSGDNKFLYKQVEEINMIYLFIIFGSLILIMLVVIFLIVRWFKKDDFETKEKDNIKFKNEMQQQNTTQQKIEDLMKNL